jgi:hypothetical protein
MGTTRTRKAIEKPVEERLADALKTQFPDAFKPEIINGVDVEEAAKNVLLSVAFSPVIPDRDGFVPCSTVELDPEDMARGMYRVYFPAHFNDHRANTTQEVTADELRVMRARYLLTLGYLRSFYDELPHHVQQAALRLYFDNKPPWTPKPGSRLANIPAEGLSIALKPGQTHADLIAEMFAEAGAGTGDVRVVMLGDDPIATARSMGFPVPPAATQEQQDIRASFLGVLSARTDHLKQAGSPTNQATNQPASDHPASAQNKPAGRPAKKNRATKNRQDTLPIAEAYYSVVTLPPATAQSPNPALRAVDGMLRAVFAVWYTSHKPDLTDLEPPDELGCYVGAQCGVEAQTAADRLIRQRKGPRSFAWPLSPEFATRVYTDGIRQRTTTLQLTGRAAMVQLGFGDDPKQHAHVTDKDVQQAYRRIIGDRRLHPDQGGSREDFEAVTLARDAALEYVRSLGEAHGRAGQSNEEREASSTLGPRGREFLVQWAQDQRKKGPLNESPHLIVSVTRSIGSIIRTLAKRGYVQAAMQRGDGTPQYEIYMLTNEGMIAATDIERKAAEKADKAAKK